MGIVGEEKENRCGWSVIVQDETRKGGWTPWCKSLWAREVT